MLHLNEILRGEACISTLGFTLKACSAFNHFCFSQEPSQFPFSFATHNFYCVYSKYSLTAWFLHSFVSLILSLNEWDYLLIKENSVHASRKKNYNLVGLIFRVLGGFPAGPESTTIAFTDVIDCPHLAVHHKYLFEDSHIHSTTGNWVPLFRTTQTVLWTWRSTHCVLFSSTNRICLRVFLGMLTCFENRQL